MNKRNISIILNILLVIFEIIGLIMYMNNNPYFDFSYYTQDSNLFALIIGIIYLICLLTHKENKIVSVLKYISVLSLSVTFLVVIFILAPMYNFAYGWMLFHGDLIFFHNLCPIIAFISFIFFEEHNISGKLDNLRATYFTILYAIISTTLNIFGIIEGPYPFLMVHKNPVYMSVIWFLVIVGGSYGIATMIMKIKNKIEHKQIN